MTRAPLGMLRALAIACLACAPHVHALAQAPTPPAPAGRSTGSAGSTSPSATGSDDALDRALRARRFEEADRLIEARIAAARVGEHAPAPAERELSAMRASIDCHVASSSVGVRDSTQT